MCRRTRTLNSIFIFTITFAAHAPVFAQSAPWIGLDFKDSPCKGRGQGYGPYDYLNRSSLDKNLRLVESAHFDRYVETLTGGAKGSGNDPLPDLDYTLRAFPNHHRALNTIIRYDLRTPESEKSKTVSPAECYLQRAINFSPKDATAHMLYGILLHRTNQYTAALTEYEKAKSLSPNDAQITYNLSLLLVELERYDEARSYAVNLYSRGFPLQGLKNKLKDAGHWD